MRIAAKLVPASCALAAFGAMTLLYVFGDRELYYEIIYRWGVSPFRFPFLDFQNSLAAWECTRRGFDVTASNPCDVLERIYNYGPIWLAFSFIPLDTSDLWWTGWLLAFLFLASIATLPAVQRPWEVAAMAAASLSTSVVFAVERANVDLIVFLLAVAVGRLVSRSRFAAYSLVVVGALLKYYPITMLVLALRERTAVFLATIGSAIVALGLVAMAYEDELARGIAQIPGGAYFTVFFSAANLPLGMEQLWPVSAILVAVGLLIVFLLGVLAILGRKALPDLGDLPEPHQTFLIIGCALILGCFFIGQSISYRAIMALFVLPGLLVMARQSRLAQYTSGAVVLLMWEGFFRHLWGANPNLDPTRIVVAPLPHWIVRELMWWWVAAVLFAILLEFAAKSRALSAAVSHPPENGRVQV